MIKLNDISQGESDLNKVLLVQKEKLHLISDINNLCIRKTDSSIKSTQSLLNELGIEYSKAYNKSSNGLTSPISVRSWNEILSEAQQKHPGEISLNDIFSKNELESNEEYFVKLQKDFNGLYKLGAVDYAICGIAGILAAIFDLILVGIPSKTNTGINAGPLSNYIRELFNKILPPESVAKLERIYKVPYDPANNKNLAKRVEGLSSWFHRYHSVGHDPILGFIFGVLDILRGTFTAIASDGSIIIQKVGTQQEGMNLYSAIFQVFGHIKSDITTSMGIPAPLMTVFNLFQFGEFGEENLSIADIIRGMYAQGYDFIHYCSTLASPMIIEAIIRLSFSIKRIKEGNSIKESIPYSNNMESFPKLQTMLFLSNSIATAFNTGKVFITGDPMSINWAQWMAFAKYNFLHFKWLLYEKPKLRDKYIQGFIDSDWIKIQNELDSTWKEFTNDSVFICV